MTDLQASMDPAALDRKRSIAIALLVAAAFFMENLDGTVITTAVPQMAKTFGVSAVDLNTGVSAYLLTLAILIPASGWVADRFGARNVFSLAIVIFTVASLLCGLSTGLTEFILLRILQGIGGAMMVPVGRLVVLKTTPKDKLIGAIAVLTWPALMAPVLGPPVGGFLTTYSSWRWIFYLNVPIGIAALVATFILIPNQKSEARRPFDWMGFGLTSGALFFLMSAIEFANHANEPWWKILGTLMVGIGLLSVAIRHLLTADHPMVELSDIRIPTFAVTIWGGSLFRMAIGAIPFLLPLLFQIAFGYDAFHAGLILIAVFLGNLLMKPATTPILERFGFRSVLIGNGCLNVLALAACALITADTPSWITAMILFLGGMTRSMQFTAYNAIAFADISQKQMSAANTVFSTAFQLTMGLGIAVGAILLRIADWLFAAVDLDLGTAAPFRFAFLALAMIAAIGLWDAIRLDPGAGSEVTRRKRASRR